MANNTSVMLIGRVGSDPVRRGNSQQGICTFRLASSRGYYDRNTRAWREQPSTWVTVKTYRTLAENVMRSVHKGEPVIVSGSLITESWTDRSSGEMRAMNVIEAATVGHDLSRGTADFNRPETAEKGGGGPRGNAAETNGNDDAAAGAPDGDRAGAGAAGAGTGAQVATPQSAAQPGGVDAEAQRAAATDAWGATAPPAAAASGYAGETAAAGGGEVPEPAQGSPSAAAATATAQPQEPSEFDGGAGGGDAY